MDFHYAEYLLQKTKEDYNKIADDFSNKRSHPSDDIKVLAKYVSSGDKILDLGCGNGRLFELFRDKDIKYFGADISEKLIAIAKEKYFHPLPSSPSERGRIKVGEATANFQVVDFLRLPFPNGYFDRAYCLSVFHHIPSKEFRLQFLREIKRVLKPNGLLILTVWNFWQGWGILKILKYAFLKIISLLLRLSIVRKFFFCYRKRFFFCHCERSEAISEIASSSANWRTPRNDKKGIAHNDIFEQSAVNFEQLDFKDVFIPFKDSGGKALAERYYHCFTKRELKKLLEKSGFEITETNILKRGKYENICLIGKNVI